MNQQEGEVADGSSAKSELGDSQSANDKPNKWVAATLSLIIPVLGMLNVAQPTWAAVYFFAGIKMTQQFAGNDDLPIAAAVVLSLGIRVVAAVHAYRLAQQYPADKPRPFYSHGPIAVGLYLGLAFLLLVLPFHLMGAAAQASCVGATCN